MGGWDVDVSTEEMNAPLIDCWVVVDVCVTAIFRTDAVSRAARPGGERELSRDERVVDCFGVKNRIEIITRVKKKFNY